MNMENPFDLLCAYEQRVLQKSSGLPADRQADEWIGLGFRVGKNHLLVDMKEVKEILKLPEFTSVPGVRSWIIGVANVRGSLLPVMDLKGYLVSENILNRQKGSVIVIDYKGFNTGLLVEEVYGMRHLTEAEEITESTSNKFELDEIIKPYIIKNYKQGEDYWPVFSFTKMTSDERFLKAAL